MKLLKKEIVAQNEQQILARWTTESKIQFQLLPANRAIKRQHANKLKALILKHGMISVPIIVATRCYNRKGETGLKYFILDGQHRVESCVQAGISFYFFVVPKESPAEIISLMGEVNNSSLNFGLDAWINAFAHVPLPAPVPDPSSAPAPSPSTVPTAGIVIGRSPVCAPVPSPVPSPPPAAVAGQFSRSSVC